MAKVLTKTNGMDRIEWLKARQQGIGGSDVAAIFGVSKYKSPLQLYQEKIGEWELTEDMSEAAELGTELEDTVARLFVKRFEQETGQTIRLKKQNAILQHPKYPWMLANLDRQVIGEKAGLECKTASEYLKAEWDAEAVPDAYMLQTQHYMSVADFTHMYIAVIIGGNKLRWKRIERDDELIDNIIAGVKYFWEEHVVKRIPPNPDGTDASTDALKYLYPTSEIGMTVNLDDPAAQSWLDVIKHYEPILADAEYKINEAKNNLKNMIGNAESAICGDFKLTWKANKKFDGDLFRQQHPELYQQCLLVPDTTPELDEKKVKQLLGRNYEQFRVPSKVRPFKIAKLKEFSEA